MSKLILCLGQETFNLEVKQIEENEEGQWRYWNYYLDRKSEETVRLIRYLGYCRYEPVWYNSVAISKTEEHTKGFFGREKVTTRYFLRKSVSDERIHPKAMYLEE